MTKEMIVYKACYRKGKGDNFVSYFRFFPDGVAVTYSIGKTSTPNIKGSLLYALTDIPDIGKLGYGTYGTVLGYGTVLECKAVVDTCPVKTSTLSLYDIEDYRFFWKQFMVLGKDSPTFLDCKSVLCHSITPYKVLFG